MLARRGRLVVVIGLLAGCPSGGGETWSQIRLSVADGAHAGTLEAVSPAEICIEGLVGPGSWGVLYADSLPGSRLGSLQLIVPAPGPGGVTSRFYLAVSLDARDSVSDHEIETRADAGQPGGSGYARIDPQGTHTVVSVTGKTSRGIGLAVSIRCHQVRRPTVTMHAGEGRREP